MILPSQPSFAAFATTSPLQLSHDNSRSRLPARPLTLLLAPDLLVRRHPTILNPFHPARHRLYQFTTSNSEFDKDYSKYSSSFFSSSSPSNDNDDDHDAKSHFGTKLYWDAMYDGMGDFAADEYSWYYGYEVIRPYLQEYGEQLLLSTKEKIGEERVKDEALVGTVFYKDKSQLSILIPGCGNDPLLLDLYKDGFRSLTAFDYSIGAIERQRELLEYLPSITTVTTSISLEKRDIELRVEDARALPTDWTNTFDIIIEKGALDAIYLSGDDNGNLEKAVMEFERVLRPGGICISCSGVVPEILRREKFCSKEWVWLRDGSDDLRAGCFVFSKR